MRRRSAAVAGGIAAAVVLVVALGANGASKTTSDPSGDTTSGTGAVKIDLTSASHSDTAATITWAFHTASPITHADVDSVQWALDLSNPANGTYLDAADACISLQDTGTVLRAQLYHGVSGCSGTADGTSDATITNAAGGSDVSFSFDLAFFRTKTGFLGTSYHYKVSSADANGYTDKVPDTGDITHTLGGSSSPTVSPTSSPGASPTSSPHSSPTSSPGASPQSSSSPSASESPSATSTSGTGSGSGSGTSSGAGSAVGTSSGSGDPATVAGSSTERSLSGTGLEVGGLALFGLALVYAGVELVGAKRRLEGSDEA